MINNGLLCSIALSMSSFPNKDDFVTQVERKCDIPDIMEARRMLFTHYKDVICPERNEHILGIKRKSTKNFILDIVNQMMKIDKTGSDMDMFCMPWNYKLKVFESEEESIVRTMENEMSTELDMKIEALEKRLNEKNRLLHSSIVESVQKALGNTNVAGSTFVAGVPSYANVVGKTGTETGAIPKILVNGADGPGVGAGLGGGWADAGAGSGGHVNRGTDSLGLRRIRSRSDSNKRRRGNDGEPVDTQVEAGNVIPPRRVHKPCVVGTAGITAGRKMRSPPADIFVWGVHNATTIEDIVGDLADSEIIIKEEDVIKKSNKEAYLSSYKISVKAEDLQKVLDPYVWPLRVKVRPFIHYSRKPKQNSVGPNPPAGADVQHERDQGERGQLPVALAPNRFALPGEQVPGGPPTV